jgi:hypothetical protein
MMSHEEPVEETEMFIQTTDDLERALGQRIRRILRKKDRDPIDPPTRTIVNTARWTHPT